MKKYIVTLLFIVACLLPMTAHAEQAITDLNKSWTITFNSKVDAATVNPQTMYIVDKYNEKIAVTYKVTDKTVTIAPVESYINYWTYRVVVTANVKDKFGKPLAEPFEHAFRTEMPIEALPKITALAAGEYKQQALVTISYDDGYANWYPNSVPLHSKYNIPATYNIIGEQIYAGDPTYMTPSEIWVAHDLGIEIASHTFTHPFLTNLNEEEIRQQFAQTNEWLIDLVGGVDTLAVPYSFYSDEIRAITQDYYKGVRVFSNDTNRPDNYDPYWLKSFAVVNTMEFDTIKQWIDRAVVEKSWVIIMLHGITENREEEYETTPEILQDILQYIQSFGRDTLLPVTTRDGLTLTSSWLQR